MGNPCLTIAVFSLPILLSFAQQCPPVSRPCECDSTPYVPVSIMCERGASLQQVLQAVAGAANAKIDRLVIRNTPIPTLPPLAFQSLSIGSLSIVKAGLTGINQGAFDGPSLDMLTELDLKDNSLGSIPQAGISKLKNLRKLYLSGNRLASIPPRSFVDYESADRLEKLDLSGNQLSQLDPNALNGLTSLKELTLEKNSFNAIPANGIKRVKNSLEDLNLGLNKINNVPTNALEFPNLKSLSLEFNGIQGIQSEAFRGVPNLRFLYLSGNKFRRFDPNMFRFIRQLEILGMGEMPIPNLPNNAFTNTPVLRRLEMTEAAVTDIQQGTFQRIRNTIAVIVLNRNQLVRIRRDMFTNLPALQSLDLQGNGMREVEDGAFENLGALQHLDLSSNQLSVLEPRTFQGTFLPTVDSKTLYLCNNPWVCDQRLEWLREWLRQNPDIMIDKPTGCFAECTAPSNLVNVRLRDLDPVTYPPTFAEAVETPAVAAMPHLGWIILAIILAILLTSICLLALVRWFVGRNRRQDKEREEEERILRSSVVSGGYRPAASVVGSAYPASGVDLDLPPAHTLDVAEQRNYW